MDQAPATPAPQAPPSSGPMTDSSQAPIIDMTVKDGDNPAFQTTNHEILDGLRANAAPGQPAVTGLSPDGSRIQLSKPVAGPPGEGGKQPTQNSEIHIMSGAHALGYKILGSHPRDAVRDPDLVDSYLSAAVSPDTNAMGADTERHKFLAGHLKENGDPDPKVVGSGNDWYTYQPQTKQWYQVTKQPSLSDKSGWESLAMQAPQMLGSGIGGTIGTGLGATGGAAAGTAMAGPLGTLLGGGAGAVAGGAAGGGLGSAAGQGVTKGVMAAFDPHYRAALSGSEEANAIGNSALKDAAVMGVAGPLGAGVGKAINWAGGLAEGVGKGSGLIAEGLGGLIKKPIVADTIGLNLPGPLGPIIAAADAAQAPQMAAQAVPAAARWAGESAGSNGIRGKIARALLSEEQSASLVGKSKDLLRYGTKAGDIGKAVDVGSTMSKMQGPIPLSEEGMAAQRAAQTFGESQGLDQDMIEKIAQQTRADFPEPGMEHWRPAAEAMSVGPMENLGRGADQFADVGAKIQQPITKAIQKFGSTLEGSGQLAQGAGSAAGKSAPYAALYGQYYGLPKAGSAIREKLLQRMIEDRDKNSVLPSR